ncbi:MAG TPA: 6-phosphogluconolactonase [Dissulfurispiraceae bacterium]|nr:6-phosphogluconolactonase [Dissulfurispiraceae bacterium]
MLEAALSDILSICADADTLAAASADHIISILSDAVRQSGTASLALSGGKTPGLYFPLLASEPRRSAVPWQHLHVFWTDERCVPPEHAESNYGMAWRLWLSHVPIPADNIHRMRGEINPPAAAREYAEELLGFFAGMPRFDLILLGIGTDGHTASLFPGTTALDAQEYACAVYVPQLSSWRITLTLPVLNNARTAIVVASGTDKASIMEKLRNAGTDSTYPAGRVRLRDGKLIWLIDAEAAMLMHYERAEKL